MTAGWAAAPFVCLQQALNQKSDLSAWPAPMRPLKCREHPAGCHNVYKRQRYRRILYRTVYKESQGIRPPLNKTRLPVYRIFCKKGISHPEILPKKIRKRINAGNNRGQIGQRFFPRPGEERENGPGSLPCRRSNFSLTPACRRKILPADFPAAEVLPEAPSP